MGRKEKEKLRGKHKSIKPIIMKMIHPTSREREKKDAKTEKGTETEPEQNGNKTETEWKQNGNRTGME